MIGAPNSDSARWHCWNHAESEFGAPHATVSTLALPKNVSNFGSSRRAAPATHAPVHGRDSASRTRRAVRSVRYENEAWRLRQFWQFADHANDIHQLRDQDIPPASCASPDRLQS